MITSMKTIIIIILTLFTTALSFAVSNPMQGQSGTDIKIASNLTDAVANIDMISLNILLAEGANIDMGDANGNTPLMIAARIGNPRMVNILLAHTPDLTRKNSEGNTALMIASEHGQTFVVEQLIAMGADMNDKNAKGFTPLDIAKRNGHASLINLLRNKTEIALSS